MKRPAVWVAAELMAGRCAMAGRWAERPRAGRVMEGPGESGPNGPDRPPRRVPGLRRTVPPDARAPGLLATGPLKLPPTPRRGDPPTAGRLAPVGLLHLEVRPGGSSRAKAPPRGYSGPTPRARRIQSLPCLHEAPEPSGPIRSGLPPLPPGCRLHAARVVNRWVVLAGAAMVIAVVVLVAALYAYTRTPL